jgi:hypothetical protein
VEGLVLGPLAALHDHRDYDDEDHRDGDTEHDPLPDLDVLGAEVVLDVDGVGAKKGKKVCQRRDYVTPAQGAYAYVLSILSERIH